MEETLSTTNPFGLTEALAHPTTAYQRETLGLDLCAERQITDTATAEPSVSVAQQMATMYETGWTGRTDLDPHSSRGY